jgi:hypothetical protein
MFSEVFFGIYYLFSMALQPGACDSLVGWGTVLKPEGCGFETRTGEWLSSIYLIFSTALGPGVHSASNRNEYLKQKNNISGE